MSEYPEQADKPLANPSPRPAEKPPIPQPAGDGFPRLDDISAPPPGSDQDDDDPMASRP